MNKKRFYKTVTVEPYEKEFAVTLDGKPIKTPVGTVLRGSEALAKAMAAEWESQTETINPDKMPITRIVSIARDRVPQDRALLIDDIVNYAGSDLLCYRAEGEVGVLQTKHHQPVLDWAAGQGIALHATESVMPVTQPDASLAKVREVVSAASDLELAALAMATPLLGSAILALAIWKGAVSVDKAITCARVDEDFQASKWGQDPEAKAQWMKREVDMRGAAQVLAFFLDS
jgi:chaperone required for assembly of F1-ATPase